MYEQLNLDDTKREEPQTLVNLTLESWQEIQAELDIPDNNLATVGQVIRAIIDLRIKLIRKA